MFPNILIIPLFLLLTHPLQGQAKLTPLKREAVQYIDKHQHQFTAYSDSIWAYAEKSFYEYKSAALLIAILKNEGFTVEENICGVATMFVASYGNSKPVIGLFGEYDADSLASNKTVPRREALIKDGYGHGAGHNLLGVGSLAAVLAVKALIVQRKLDGTIKYFGTTAEGGLGGKTYLAKRGYFNDLDLSVYWHPSPVTAASTHSWDALIDCRIRFAGERAHAFRDTVNPKNPLNAVSLFIQQIQTLHKPTKNIRINYLIEYGGKNIRYTPDSAVVRLRIQGADQIETVATFQKIGDAAYQAAKMAGVTFHLEVTRAMHEFKVNIPAMKLIYHNMKLLGPIQYTVAEQEYARQMQEHLALPQEGIKEQILSFTVPDSSTKMYGYASDIGDASWFAPEIYFVVCALPPVPMHNWPTTAFTAHAIGHKGMLYAAKVMAATIVDYLQNDSVRQAIKQDFEAKTKHYKYRSLIEYTTPPIGENSKTN